MTVRSGSGGPTATEARSCGRDGFPCDGRHAGAKSHEPDSFGGPAGTGRPPCRPVTGSGETGNAAAPSRAEDDEDHGRRPEAADKALRG